MKHPVTVDKVPLNIEKQYDTDNIVLNTPVSILSHPVRHIGPHTGALPQHIACAFV